MTGGRLALAQTIACLALLAPWIVARAQDQMIQGGAASAGGASAPAAAVDPGTSLAAPGSALESAVDADAYRLGPGDVLTIGIWGPQPIVYDLPVTLEGKLLQFAYRNPHSYVTIQAPDDKGVQQRWSVEWSGTTQLTNQGITQQTLKVGDQVRVVGRPSRVRNEHRALMVSLLRPADGFTWGTRAGEKVD